MSSSQAKVTRPSHRQVERDLKELLLDSLPHPTMLIRRDRVLLTANRIAREGGAVVGGYCWREFARCEYVPERDKRYLEEHGGEAPPGGTSCTFCMADEALASGESTRNPEVEMFGRVHDVWWTPTGNDTYLHYAIDITERKRTQERAERLNAVLRAVRNVNQLIATEKDRGRLVQRACDSLVETRGYYCAWIALLDEAGKLTTMAEAGLGDHILPLREQLARGDWPACIRRAMTAPGALMIEDTASVCADCPLAGQYAANTTMATRLTHGGKTYGALAVAMPGQFTSSEEQSLFEEVAGDVAFALHDIRLMEEREQARRALARSNAELRQFAYAASHDLQEPLRVMTSYLQLLDRRYGDQLDAEAQRFIDYVVDEAARMREMVKGLLAYSRLDESGKTLALEPTDCAAILEQVRADLEAKIEESEARVTHDPLPTIKIESFRMRQVFQNLIDNAIKFRREGVRPRVHVSAERIEEAWLFSVRDNGIGIAPGHVERVFEAFQRLHTRDEYAGAGMGLPLCRRIVEGWGGNLWVVSEPDEGSTFYFTVPSPPGRESQM